MSAGPSPQVLLRRDARGACCGTRANAVRARLSCARPRGAPASRSTASGPPPAGARKKRTWPLSAETGPTRRVLQPGYGPGEQCPHDHHPLHLTAPSRNSPRSRRARGAPPGGFARNRSHLGIWTALVWFTHMTAAEARSFAIAASARHGRPWSFRCRVDTTSSARRQVCESSFSTVARAVRVARHCI